MQSGYNISELVGEAQTRWLKPAEVLFILQNHESHQLTNEPPQRPASGSLFLFNKRILRFFRKDGHSWRRKKDGRTVGEAHERLKVGNAEALNCYYAHGEQNPNFQRRSYWMLDPTRDHIVLVHYRDICEVKPSSGSIIQFSPGFSGRSCSTATPDSYTTQYHNSSASVRSKLHEPCRSLASPGSAEVSSHGIVSSNGLNQLDMSERSGEASSLSKQEFNQALRKLEEQLSLNDDSLEDIGSFYSENENLNSSEYTVQDQLYCKTSGMQDDLINVSMHSVNSKEHSHHHPGNGFTPQFKSSVFESAGKNTNASDANVLLPAHSFKGPEEERKLNWNTLGVNSAQDGTVLLPQENGSTILDSFFPSASTYGSNSNYYTTLFDQDQIEAPLEPNLSLTVAQRQKFSIREISPECGYASEATKVIIVGSFFCDPSDGPWACMFGDIEVPIHIIQEGVICCKAPPHLPGKVTLCITSGNRESCSEVREFEYLVKPSSSDTSKLSETETRSPEQLLLLVRFVRTLLSDPVMQTREITDSGDDILGKVKTCEDSWDQLIDSLLVGNGTQSSTTDWLLQELLKDKLQQWLSSRPLQASNQEGCSLSKKEQGIIHMVAGLGFEWALNPILNSGVNINFRDIKGWTALHWAAHFGREKMVASLIASGASAGAVTDPNSLDPIGKTPASVAASSGHKGVAGYLSEVALTSHLSSLTLVQSELSKGSADVEAERTLSSVSGPTMPTNEDHLSLKDTLAAVRNAAQAAARIQSAFRAHSFRRRKIRKAFNTDSFTGDDYSILSNDAKGLSAAAKLAFGKARDYNAAALSIQKNYRRWKGRKDFLALRQKVVKIQAHVRGHQVRKHYKVCWAVGILEKVVLRWRRHGVGLRGFRQDLESINESDEDILKVFRKQKVDATIDEAVSRVLSMVDSLEARQQYRRILEKYRQAKAELEGWETEASSSYDGSPFMDNDDIYS